MLLREWNRKIEKFRKSGLGLPNRSPAMSSLFTAEQWADVVKQVVALLASDCIEDDTVDVANLLAKLTFSSREHLVPLFRFQEGESDFIPLLTPLEQSRLLDFLIRSSYSDEHIPTSEYTGYVRLVTRLIKALRVLKSSDYPETKDADSPAANIPEYLQDQCRLAIYNMFCGDIYGDRNQKLLHQTAFETLTPENQKDALREMMRSGCGYDLTSKYLAGEPVVSHPYLSNPTEAQKAQYLAEWREWAVYIEGLKKSVLGWTLEEELAFTRQHEEEEELLK